MVTREQPEQAIAAFEAQRAVLGDAANVATRPEEISQRGEMLVGPDTYRLTAPFFDFETRPPITVKLIAEARAAAATVAKPSPSLPRWREYIFKHHLTQEAAYSGLPKRDRRAFHRRVAEALERLFPERIAEQLGLLAYRWERAEEPAKATEYLLRAGDQARLSYAHEEAAGFYQRARRFLQVELEEPIRECLAKDTGRRPCPELAA